MLPVRVGKCGNFAELPGGPATPAAPSTKAGVGCALWTTIAYRAATGCTINVLCTFRQSLVVYGERSKVSDGAYVFHD
jgi:hypothetical protein